MRAYKKALAAFCMTGALAVNAPAVTAGALDGKDYAEQVCAQCHGVLAEDRTSPDSNAPTFREIAEKPFWTRTSLMVWFQTPHEVMPSLMLKPDDKENVVEYILSLRGDAQTGAN